MKVGDLIDNRFKVEAICSTAGGMGNVLFVSDEFVASHPRLVLKYCKQLDPKLLRRFAREVKLLQSFAGNDRVAQVVAFNKSHDPPYYVMLFYPDGDLTAYRPDLVGNPTLQESVFSQMIDCVGELHARNVVHRDIKPQKFLRNGAQIAVSDLGLSIEDSANASTLTSSGEAWGTYGYAPPEFRTNGFRDADAAADVFMLGKSFYVLLTGRDPVYMTSTGISPGIFHVILRACAHDKDHRYQDLASLKQALVAAYDIILGRVDGPSKCKRMLSAIHSKLQAEHQFEVAAVVEFVDSLLAVDPGDQDEVLQALTRQFFNVISQGIPEFDARRLQFLNAYGVMVHRENYGWSFAEHIALCMREVFQSSATSLDERSVALQLAVDAAHSQSRFAAMDTCRDMICSITDDVVAEAIRPVLLNYRNTFVGEIEPVRCDNDIIRQTIRKLKEPTA